MPYQGNRASAQNRLDQESTICQKNGATPQFRYPIIRKRDNTYYGSVDGLNDSQWELMVKLTYHRQKT